MVLVLFTAHQQAGAWLIACAGLDAFKGLAKKTVVPAVVTGIVLIIVGGIASADPSVPRRSHHGRAGAPGSGHFPGGHGLQENAQAGAQPQLAVPDVYGDRWVPLCVRRCLTTTGSGRRQAQRASRCAGAWLTPRPDGRCVFPWVLLLGRGWAAVPSTSCR